MAFSRYYEELDREVCAHCHSEFCLGYGEGTCQHCDRPLCGCICDNVSEWPSCINNLFVYYPDFESFRREAEEEGVIALELATDGRCGDTSSVVIRYAFGDDDEWRYTEVTFQNDEGCRVPPTRDEVDHVADFLRELMQGTEWHFDFQVQGELAEPLEDEEEPEAAQAEPVRVEATQAEAPFTITREVEIRHDFTTAREAVQYALYLLTEDSDVDPDDMVVDVVIPQADGDIAEGVPPYLRVQLRGEEVQASYHFDVRCRIFFRNSQGQFVHPTADVIRETLSFIEQVDDSIDFDEDEFEVCGQYERPNFEMIYSDVLYF